MMAAWRCFSLYDSAHQQPKLGRVGAFRTRSTPTCSWYVLTADQAGETTESTSRPSAVRTTSEWAELSYLSREATIIIHHLTSVPYTHLCRYCPACNYYCCSSIEMPMYICTTVYMYREYLRSAGCCLCLRAEKTENGQRSDAGAWRRQAPPSLPSRSWRADTWNSPHACASGWKAPAPRTSSYRGRSCSPLLSVCVVHRLLCRLFILRYSS